MTKPFPETTAEVGLNSRFPLLFAVVREAIDGEHVLMSDGSHEMIRNQKRQKFWVTLEAFHPMHGPSVGRYPVPNREGEILVCIDESQNLHEMAKISRRLSCRETAYSWRFWRLGWRKYGETLHPHIGALTWLPKNA